MLTKQQKSDQIADSVNQLKKSDSLILVDFGGLPTAELKRLRSLLREFNAKFKVIKKRLLKIAFQREGLEVDPTAFETQVGTIFSPSDLYAIAGKIYKFTKELAKNKKDLKILSVFDVKNRKAISVEEFNAIAKLPSREVLLAQVAMILTIPIKKLLLVLNSRVKNLNNE